MSGNPTAQEGRGVFLYKNWGFYSEEVCEIGKWKNISAFATHYLRLNATDRAAEKLQALVHKISPGGSAEPELSRTPPSQFGESGGGDSEGEAQDTGEIRLPVAGCPVFFSSRFLLCFC